MIAFDLSDCCHAARHPRTGACEECGRPCGSADLLGLLDDEATPVFESIPVITVIRPDITDPIGLAA